MAEMKNLTVIEETHEYTIFTAQYRGTIQRFRKWAANQVIEIAFTDDFCRANGYQGRADMLRKEPEMRERLKLFLGDLPEWVQIVNGEFCVSVIWVN